MKKRCQESWQLWPSCSWSWSRWRWWCQCWNPVSAAPCTVGATSPNLPLGQQDGGDRAGGGGWWRLDWQWRWCSEPKTVWFVTMRMVICVHHILEIHLPMKTRWHELTFDLFFRDCCNVRQRGPSECIPGFKGSEDKELGGGEAEQRVIVKEVRLLQVSWTLTWERGGWRLNTWGVSAVIQANHVHHCWEAESNPHFLEPESRRGRWELEKVIVSRSQPSTRHQTKLCDLSNGFFRKQQQAMREDSDPSMSKMCKRRPQGWEPAKELREVNGQQTKLGRNKTSSEQSRPCKRSAAKLEEKSRKGKLANLLKKLASLLLHCPLLILLLQAVTKVQPKFFWFSNSTFNLITIPWLQISKMFLFNACKHKTCPTCLYLGVPGLGTPEIQLTAKNYRIFCGLFDKLFSVEMLQHLCSMVNITLTNSQMSTHFCTWDLTRVQNCCPICGLPDKLLSEGSPNVSTLM